MTNLMVAVISATNNYLKNKKFKKLYAIASMKTVKVLRKGKIRNVSVFDLLVGDVLQIEEGDIIPVDGIVCKENSKPI